ncbi:type 4 pilus major pilin [Pectobacterium versatile]|uniref:type 4 pilus major pilin n=1 Tax=Pectobacterium versatile TaxID=2488639 RepID=UPI001CD0FEC2|nr:type 4 pilus major pilin [Pectobacterium versatile]
MMILLKERKNKKGFSLLELILVMGVIAALVVAVFIVYPKVQASQRAEAEVKNIALIQAGTKSLYSAVSSYSGLAITTLVKAKVLPESIQKTSGAASSMVNVWKGNISVSSADTGPSGAIGSSFIITYRSVPAVECAKLVSSLSASFYSIEIGADTVKDSNGSLDIASVTSSCSRGGENNTVSFTSL